jgi:hypothetical protein
MSMICRRCNGNGFIKTEVPYYDYYGGRVDFHTVEGLCPMCGGESEMHVNDELHYSINDIYRLVLGTLRDIHSTYPITNPRYLNSFMNNLTKEQRDTLKDLHDKLVADLRFRHLTTAREFLDMATNKDIPVKTVMDTMMLIGSNEDYDALYQTILRIRK